MITCESDDVFRHVYCPGCFDCKCHWKPAATLAEIMEATR